MARFLETCPFGRHCHKRGELLIMIADTGKTEIKLESDECAYCGCRLSGSQKGVVDRNGKIYCSDCYASMFYPDIAEISTEIIG